MYSYDVAFLPNDALDAQYIFAIFQEFIQLLMAWTYAILFTKFYFLKLEKKSNVENFFANQIKNRIWKG